MYATNYFESMILGTLRGQTATAPQGLYLALYVNSPGESGVEGAELHYAGYTRQPLTFSSPAPMHGGVGVTNVTDVTFQAAPAALGTVTHIGVMDSPTGGNMLLYGAFSEAITVDAGEAPVIVAGEAQWWLAGDFSAAFATRTFNLLHGQSIGGCMPYLALYHGNPEDGGAELSGENYARVPLAFGAPAEQAGGQMRITTSEAAIMARASTHWGSWSYTVLCDGERGGTVLAYMERPAKELRKGMQVMVAAGEINVAVH